MGRRHGAGGGGWKGTGVLGVERHMGVKGVERGDQKGGSQGGVGTWVGGGKARVGKGWGEKGWGEKAGFGKAQAWSAGEGGGGGEGRGKAQWWKGNIQRAWKARWC